MDEQAVSAVVTELEPRRHQRVELTNRMVKRPKVELVKGHRGTLVTLTLTWPLRSSGHDDRPVSLSLDTLLSSDSQPGQCDSQSGHLVVIATLNLAKRFVAVAP